MTELQRYTYNRKTYFVDYRLKQFRTDSKPTEPIEFIDFESDKGDRILVKMIKDNVLDLSQYNY